MVPQLATSYKVSADKKTYTFTLRQGVKFSTGQPMTSKDVKFSIDQNTKASQGWGFINTAIKSVDAPSPDTVVVHLKYPWAPLLADLSLFANGIVPDNYGGKTEKAFYDAPVGTGPFKWDVWHKGSALTLVKNPLYWEKGKPYLDSITWTDVPSDNTRQQQLQGGQAQIDQFPAWSTVTQLQSTQGVNMHLFNSTQTNYLAFNELAQAVPGRARAPRDLAGPQPGRAGQGGAVRPRQAGQLAVPAAGAVLRPEHPRPTSSTWPRPRRRWPSPSVPKGFSTTIAIPSGNSDYLTIATIIQSELKPLGITVKINTARPEHREHPVPEPEVRHDAVAVDDGHQRPGRAGHLRGRPEVRRQVVLHHPTTTRPWSRPRTTAEKTLDTEKRQQLYNTLQTGAAKDAFMAFLYYSPYPYATTTNVHGFFVTPLGNMHMENVWLSK